MIITKMSSMVRWRQLSLRQVILFSRGSSFSSKPMPPCAVQPETYKGLSYEDVARIRRDNLSPTLFSYYKKPLLLTQGHMQWLFDHTGKRYLDMFAGIVTTSVGHCHPEIVKVTKQQVEKLWHTSNVYWHPWMHEYAQKLTQLLPENLKVCYFTNTGSEANDLAVMMARLHTGSYDIISLQNSYHGGSPTTMGLTGMSTWKHNFPNGFGMHYAMNPDVFNGLWGGTNCRDSPAQTYRKCNCEPGICTACDNYVQQFVETVKYSTPNQKLAGFFAEPIQGVGGLVQYPKGYLKAVSQMVRKLGGLYISDEVQTGFGRTGEHYWGFQSDDIVPDIVTMAKGIGNGIPLGAVVTTPEIAKSLTGALHFNTFGGSPVVSAIGLAVLNVIQDENLQRNCHRVGTHLIKELLKLREKFEIVGDVRGKGLMIGVELVTDKETRKPLKAEIVLSIFEKCQEMGLLVGKGGFYGNVFRIQPPMCITQDDADFCVDVLQSALLNVV